MSISHNAEKCGNNLHKIYKIFKEEGIEKYAILHDLIVDVIELLEDGRSIEELYDLQSQLADYATSSVANLKLSSLVDSFAANLKKISSVSEYSEFLQILTAKQDKEEMQFWTHQQEESDGDLADEWEKAVDTFNNGGDINDAYIVFTSLGDSGFQPACYYAGAIHEYGKLGEPNMQQAFQWYYKGAQDNENRKGDSDCQLKLYYFYHDGIGVEKDIQKAVYWLQEATVQGNKAAMTSMAHYFLFETNTHYEQAFTLVTQAIADGYEPAKTLAAYCYMKGYGTAVDLQKAEELLSDAERLGFKEARPFIEMLAAIKMQAAAKSHSSTSTSQSSSYQSTASTGKAGDSEKDDSKYTIGCIVIAVLVALGYFFGSKVIDMVSELFEEEGPTMYFYREHDDLYKTSDLISHVDYDFHFGTAARTFGNDEVVVKVRANGYTGYTFRSALITEEEFNQLKSMFGDEDARYAMDMGIQRTALIHFRQNIARDYDFKVYGDENGRKNVFWNGDMSNGHGAFAFIAENKVTGECIAALYLYDEHYKPILEVTDYSVRMGQYIVDVKQNKKGKYYIKYGGKPIKKTKRQTTKTVTSSSGYSSQQSQETQSSTSHEQKYGIGTRRLLTESDIYGYTKNDLRILRNWIYARHGYRFKTADMRSFFENEPWYEGRYDDVSSMLTDIEQQNVEFIKRHE